MTDSSNLNGTTNSCDENDDNIVTMVDVLKAEEIMEENADAVLGAGDDKNCTYGEGYMKRQALYSCLTCLPAESAAKAGICLACSYHCHADHNLVELYTKRNFKCDCGNSLFNGWKCSLYPEKSEENEKNHYNQNFQGMYCLCSRPYPDPEDEVEDEMIQCAVCEDWFHTRHLGTNVPKEDDYAEMICSSCSDKLPFLQYYLGHSVNKVSKADETDNSLDVNVSVDENGMNTSQDQGANVAESPAKNQAEGNSNHFEDKEAMKKDLSENSMAVKNETSAPVVIGVPQDKAKITSPAKKVDKETDPKADKECLLKDLKQLPRESGATFWPGNFRKLLCTCDSCLDVYETSHVPFITDEEDTVRAYEDKGKARQAGGSTPTSYERGMEALSSLDRVQQMEAILSYNDMKTHLSEYLAKFAENKKVVREEDIREFFSGMQARKRQKLDISYSCR